MPLTAGTRLGPYEIQSALGAGGMGEVYRARDGKLGRDVAIKILPDIFAADPERLARFEREAQVLASLNHTNIAAIYGIEEHPAALVLEFVDGPTLAERLSSGPLPLADALDIARQIVDALEAAHDQGIVHRDLKPANIKLRPDGTVKVLDFGLAKLGAPADGLRSSLVTNSPTLTMQATYAGMILGTAAYMSPEQAKGKSVDRRADIWAFGVVLAEMLTGKRMYDGETAPETLARVIEREPDLSALPASTPDAIRSLLARCLTKDPRNRLQAIGEARIVIERALAGRPDDPLVSGPARAPRHTLRTRKRARAWIAALTTFAVLATVSLLQHPWQTAAPSAPIRMTVTIGADASLTTNVGTAAVLSPDGHMLAFAAESGGKSLLYVRRLDQLQATPLAGTDDAYGPFFSPDGEWIAFFAGNKLKKVSILGGAVVTLCDTPSGRGGFWSDDDTIVLQPNIGTSSSGFVRVSASGGTPVQLTKQEEIGRGRYPQVLPGGKAVLYTRYAPGTEASVMLQVLATGERKVLLPGAYARYVASGHILYLQRATLFAVAFDVNRLELAGQPAPIIEGVSAADNMAAAQFAVSDTGTLAYVPGTQVNIEEVPILWLARGGKTSLLRAQPANWSSVEFSPDGHTLAINILDESNEDLFTYEWESNRFTRLTYDPASDRAPVWTPDGQRIAFASSRDTGNNSAFNMYWQRADGTGEVQRLTESRENQTPGSWYPSGKFLAFSETSAINNPDLWILPIEGDETRGWKPGTPTLFLRTPGTDTAPASSPDGRWIAYQSNVSGRGEVYVRAFPGPGGPWQISFGGGSQPKWSRTQSELFYNGPERRIMAVPYRVDGNSFRADAASVWADTRVPQRPRQGSYDLHPDGARFAVAPESDQPQRPKQDTLVVVFNFFDELRRLAPRRR